MQKPLPLLLYADDLAILGTRAEGLQNMLDALQDFSKKRRLTVNLEKTEVLVFELRHTPCRDFTYGGRVLTRKDSFKYLGLWFHATQRDFRLALGVLQLLHAKPCMPCAADASSLVMCTPSACATCSMRIGAAHPQLWL